MKLFDSRGAFPLLCLAVGLAVFAVSYTMLGEGSKDEGAKAPESPTAANEMMFKAMVEDDVERLELALSGGADPNAFDDDGISALQWAILGSGKAKTVYGQVKALLTAGANPNLANDRGWTPLHYASRFGGSEAVVSTLIESGGDPNITNSQSTTPLQLALLTGNRGAVSALKKATPIRPEHYEKWEAMSNISTRLKSAATQEGKKAVFTKDLDSLVRRGWLSETEKEAVLNAIENNAGCTTCD